MIEPLKITEDEANVFRSAKRVPPALAKPLRKKAWADIRARLGLSAEMKYSVQLDDPNGLNYLVVHEKRTGLPVGGAHSGMRYGSIPIATMIPFLNTNYDEPSTLPVDATAIGGGLFVKDGDLFFPLY